MLHVCSTGGHSIDSLKPTLKRVLGITMRVDQDTVMGRMSFHTVSLRPWRPHRYMIMMGWYRPAG